VSDGPPRGLNDVAARVRRLEEDVRALDEIVEGQQPWSHRTRLHNLENDDRGVAIAAEALRAYRDQRNSVYTRVREWGAFVLAAAAIALAHWG
jgi:hypothetical protein